MKKIYSKYSPDPIWPYSQWIRIEDVLFLSAQDWTDSETLEIIKGWVEAETTQAIKNIENILKEEDLNLSNIVKINIYLTDIWDIKHVDKISMKYLPHRPARRVVGVSELQHGACINIEVTAIAF